MFFTSKKKYLADNVREVKISEDSNLPQLYRLYTDFGFAVIAMSNSSSTPKNYALCEVGLDRNTTTKAKKVSPEFSSLSELEAYTADNVVEILEKYMFGDEKLDDDSMPVAM